MKKDKKLSLPFYIIISLGAFGIFYFGFLFFSQKMEERRVEEAKNYEKACKAVESLVGFKQRALNSNKYFNSLNDSEVASFKELFVKIDAEKNCKKRLKLFKESEVIIEKEKEARLKAELEKNKKEWMTKIKDTGEDIGDFVINGIYFHVPRKYIWFGTNAADGVETGLNLLFYYPGMESEPASSEKKIELTDINVLIESGKFNDLCLKNDERNVCASSASWAFIVSSSHGDSGFDLKCYLDLSEGKKCNYNVASAFDKIYDEEMKMHRFGAAHYYRGITEIPDYWLECTPAGDTGPNPRCESYIMLNDELVMKYSFSRKFMYEHEKIHDLLIEKVNSFIEKD